MQKNAVSMKRGGLMIKATNLLKHSLCGVLFASLSLSQCVQANQTDIKFAGFASFVYAKTFDRDEGEIKGPDSDITNEGDLRKFNKLGLRMDVDYNENLEFAAQVVAYGANNYDPEFDWIYARIKLSSEFSADVGKIRVPLYMYSDFIDVSYAYEWLNPPVVIYGNTFFKTFDGGKISYLTDIGDWSSEVILFTGSTEQDFVTTGKELTVEIDRTVGIAWTVDYEWVALRAVYAELDVSLTGFDVIEDMLGGLDTFAGAINSQAPGLSLPLINLSEFADEIRLEDDKNQYYGFGASFNFEQFFAATEITHSEVEHSIATGGKDAFYLMLGTKLPHHWSLSFTYGYSDEKLEEEIIDEIQTLTKPYMGTALESTAVLLNKVVEGAVTEAHDKETSQYILGARWDFHPSVSLKLEYQLQDYEGFTFNSSSFAIEDDKSTPSAYLIGIDLIF